MRSHAGQKITAVLLAMVLIVSTVPAPVSVAGETAAAEYIDAAGEALTEEAEETAKAAEEERFGEEAVEEQPEKEQEVSEEQQTKTGTASDLSTEAETNLSEDSEEMKTDMESINGTETELPDTEKQETAEPVTETLEEEEIPEKEFDVRAASDITRDEALAWVNDQVGKQLDYDGRYGAQCTDLIYYYYRYLGAAVLYGNASAYATNALPAGWSRISYNSNVKDVQPGDIAVWTGTSTGHAAIVVSADANGFHVAEQNYALGADGTYDYGDVPCAIRYHEGYKHYNGGSLLNCVIRPNFKASVPSEPAHGSYQEEGCYPVIPDGDYHIVSSLGDQWWLTNAGFSMDNGGNVQLWQYDDKECDEHLYHFEFIPDGNGIGKGFYIITNKLSGKCLDVYGNPDANTLYDTSGKRRNVQQWDYDINGSAAQQWAINELDGGEKGMLYTFQVRSSGYYMDVESGAAASGTNISMWEGNGSAAQQWRLIPWAPTVGRTIDDGTYQLAPHAAAEKVLGASANNPQGGANIELNSYKGDYRHAFDVRYLGNGYYSIINSYSGTSLYAESASRKLGTNIELWEYSEGNDAQKWIIKSCGGGYYNVVSKCNGLYLDLEGGGVADGTNISLWKWEDGNTNQKWKFIPYEPPKEEESSSAAEESSAVTESAPTEESSTPPESETDSSGAFEEEDPQDGVKWHYNEQQVTYRDLSMYGEIAAAIKPKTYDGTPYKPAVKVTTVENGKTVTLTEGADYRVLYFNNVHAGTGRVIVRGNGIYRGTVSKNFAIKKKSCKKLKVIADSMPAGSTLAPKVYVYDGATLLAENKDYILDGITPDLTAAKGKKQIRVLAAGASDYEGMTYAKITVYDADNTRIRGIIDNPEAVKLSQSVYPYTGKSCRPTAVVTVNGQTLTAGKDYAITYQNNKEAGTAFAVITGRGSYVGSVVKKFTIEASGGEFTLKKPIAAKTYNGKLQKPKLTVMANGKTLRLGRDYTLTYTNNLHATDRARVTVRGKGNYTDIPAKTFYFTINPCHIKKASVKGAQGSLTLTYAKHTLVEGTDYDIIYGSAAGRNKITVTIKAKEGGSFTGEVTKKVNLDTNIHRNNYLPPARFIMEKSESA